MWTLADANTLRAATGRDVVVVGAGFIGLIILDALLKRGCRVRFLEIAPQILPRMLDEAVAGLVAAHLRERDVELLTDTGLESVERRQGRLHLKLAGGTALECDQLVMATGIRANTEFLEGSGIASEAGILVGEQLETSAPAVFAAGDVAQGPDLLAGGTAVHAIQPTAIDHGRVAGANMAGQGVPYSGSLAMNVLHTRDLESCSFGLWHGDGHECTVVENSGDRIYRKYVWDDDRLVGGALVGPTAAVSGVNDVGMLKGLIQSGVALGPWKDYLQQNPLDLRRAFVASGATEKLLGTTLLTGRPSAGGGYRYPPLPPLRKRSPHHPVLTTGLRR
jgi:NADPH-dependent 2,4-dienoyl-CoA reductase/sulfur reductase-like enzyme